MVVQLTALVVASKYNLKMENLKSPYLGKEYSDNEIQKS